MQPGMALPQPSDDALVQSHDFSCCGLKPVEARYAIRSIARARSLARLRSG